MQPSYRRLWYCLPVEEFWAGARLELVTCVLADLDGILRREDTLSAGLKHLLAVC